MAQKTYFLMPNFTYKPDKHLKLGQLIKSYDKPLELLAEPLDEPLPRSDTQLFRKWRELKSDGHRFSVGIFTQFLAQFLGIGADIDVTTSKRTISQIDADELESRYFEPDDDYVARSAGRDEVKKYLQEHRLKPIYMITGLKIARGARYSSTTSTYVESAAQVGIDASAAILVPGAAQIGPKMKVQKPKEEQILFHGSTDFIYAYRLQRVIVTWRRVVKSKLYSKGANTLSNDDNLDEVEEVIGEHGEGDEEIEDISLDDCDYGSMGPVPSGFEPRQAIDKEDEKDGMYCKVLLKKSVN